MVPREPRVPVLGGVHPHAPAGRDARRLLRQADGARRPGVQPPDGLARSRCRHRDPHRRPAPAAERRGRRARPLRRRAGSALAGTLAVAVAQAAFAGPPFLTDDPEPTDTGHWEIYAPAFDASGKASDYEGSAGAE